MKLRKMLAGGLAGALFAWAMIAGAATLTNNFSNSNGLTLSDSTLFDFDGSVVKLLVSYLLRKDNTQAGFDAGTHALTSWQTDKVALTGPLPLINTNSLVGLWNLNESAGASVAYDLTEGQNGTPTNGATFTSASAKFNNSASLDGVDDYITVPATAALEPASSITIMAWIRPTGSGSDSDGDWFLTKGRANAAPYLSYGLDYIASSGTIRAQFAGGGAYNSIDSSSNAAPLNTWTHVAATYDGTTRKLYINGSLASTGTTGTGSISYGLNISNDLRIGLWMNPTEATNNTSPKRAFQGLVDDVMVFSRVLSASEISSLGAATREMTVLKNTSIGASMTGLVSYWKLDDGSGTSSADAQGTNTGTLTAGPVWVTASKAGAYAVKFDGVDDYIRVPDAASLDRGTGDFSLSTWVQSTASTGAHQAIVSKSAGGLPAGYQLFLLDTGYIQAAVSNGSGSVAFTSTASSYKADGLWHHVVMTKASGLVTLYIDGIKDTSATYTGTMDVTNAKDFLIGAQPTTDTPSTPGSFFKGSIDDVAFWNVALTPAQVADLYRTSGYYTSTTVDQTASGTGWKTLTATSSADFGVPLEKPPVAYYKLDEGTGTSTTADASGNSYTGTLTGSPSWSSSTPTTVYSDPYCLAFNGSSQYVTLATTSGAAAPFNVAAPFTFSTWVKSTSDTFQGLYGISQYSSSSNYFFIAIGSGVTVGSPNELITIGNGVGSTYVLCYNTDTRTELFDGNWHHVAAVTNGSAWSIYLDGKSKTVTNVTNSNNGVYGPFTSADSVSIGALRRISSTDGYLNGSMDDTVIYSRALTPLEIAELASGARQPRVPSNTYEKSLVGLWHLDNDALDALSISNGTLAGSVAFKPGVDGASASYTTVNDKITFPSLDLGTTHSVSYWVNFSDLTNDGIIVAQTNGSGKYLSYFDNASPTGLLYYNDGGGPVSLGHGGMAINSWHHFVVTRSGSTLNFYKDGVLIGTKTLGTNNSVAVTTLGSQSDNSIYTLVGKLDEVALFNVALSSSQVADIYQRGAAKIRFQAATNSSDSWTSPSWAGGGFASPGTVGLWHFNEASGATSIADSSGNSFTGTATSVTAGAPGVVGNGITFNGTSSNISVADNALQRPSTVSVGCWFKTTQTTGGALICKPSKANAWSAYILYVNATANKVSMYGDNSGGTAANCASTTSVNDGAWHHAVGTADGTNFRIYVDGVLENTVSAAGRPYYFANNDLNIGRYDPSAGAYFNGTLDEVFIYGRVLTGEEIYKLYESGKYINNPSGQTLAALNNDRYLRYRVLYDSALGNHLTGDIQSVSVYGNSSIVPTSNPYLTLTTGQAFTYLTSFTETATKPANTDIQYQLSPNNGTTWYYHNGSNWVTSDGTYAQSAAASAINTNIAGFDDKAYNDGNLPANSTGTLKFRAFFNSNGTATPSLDTLAIGYETGSITLTAPNSGEYWKVGSAKNITWTTTGTVPPDLTLEYTKDNTNYTLIVANVSTGGGIEKDPAAITTAAGVWRMNEGSGQATADTGGSSTGQLGSTSGADASDPTWVAGKWSNALSFDGTDDYVTIPSLSLTPDSNSVTVAGWIKLTGTGNVYNILGEDVSGGGTFRAELTATSKLFFYVRNGTGATCYSTGATTLQTNLWYHVAFVWDSAAKSTTVYLNGVSDASDAAVGMSLTGIPTAFTALGKIPTSGAIPYYFKGVMDDIAVWKRALTGAEIQQLAGGGGYAWTIPDVFSYVNVRARSASVPSVRDSSDSNFVIADLNVVSPNGGEYWKVGTTQSILWHTYGNPSNLIPNDITVEYTKDGTTFTSIATNQTALGSVGADPATVSGAVATWRFENNANDSAGSNNGTLNGGLGYAAGKWTQGLQLDGVDDYVSVPDNDAAFDPGTNDFTVSGWFKPTNNNTYTLISHENSVSPFAGWYLRFNQNIYAGLDFWDGTTVFPILSSFSSVSAGAWNHICMVRSGTTATFYVNGKNVGSVAVAANIPNSSNTLRIGASQTSAEVFSGGIDDVAIYNRALTASEVRLLAGGGYAWTVPSAAASGTVKVRVRSASKTEITDMSDANFAVYTLDITAPNTAVSWPAGSSKSITWTHNILPGSTVKLELSTDSGSTWLGTAIATGVAKGAAGSGSYNWTVTNNTTSQGRIRITDETAGAVQDVSDVDFTISGPIISVTNPTGSSVFPVTTTQSIKWSVDGPIPTGGTVRISYSTDGGTNYTTMTGADTVDATTGAAGFDWPVPLAAASATAKVKVEDNPAWTPAATDGISAQFNISAFVTLLKPNGGERWATGQAHNITWQTQGTVSNVKLEYSTAGAGGPWTTITASTGNDGSESWTPAANLAGTNTMIRVSNAADAGANDVSDAAFTLSAVAVTQPTAAGVRWLAGSAQNITWTSVGGMTNVKLEYSTAGSSGPWSPVQESEGTANDGIVVNDGTFSWTVPLNTTTTGDIRVMDADALPAANGSDTALATDLSDNAFAIIGTLDVTVPDTANLSWASGQSQTITWNISPANANVIPNVKIEVIDFIDGANTKFITNSTPGHNVSAGSGSFAWIPDFTTTNAKVKIYDAADSATFNQADNAVKLTGISMNLPTGGESWAVGSQQVIKFGFTAGTLTDAKVEYSPDGTNYTVAAAGSLETSPDGTNWTAYAANGSAVPVSNNPFFLRWTVADAISATNQARIKITNTANSAFATTNGFTITGVLSMATPATLTVGQSATVSWTKTGTIGTVKVEFSPSGNFSGDEVTVGTGLTGTSTSWTVADNVGTTGKLRVTDTVSGHPATSSTSNAFAIKGVLAFTSPNGSSIWGVSDNRTVTWTSTGTGINNVKIEYATSTDSYTTWTNVFASTANDGTEAWNAIPDVVGGSPNPPSPLSAPTNGSKSVKLRITDLSHAGAAQAIVESPIFTIKWWLITFNVQNPDGQFLAGLDVTDSQTWSASSLASPTATKRHYKFAATENATWSKTGFTASTASFSPDSDKTITVLVESDQPTTFEVKFEPFYDPATDTVKAKTYLLRRGLLLNDALLGSSTIEIYSGTTLKGSFTDSTPDANGIYEFSFDASDNGLTAADSFLVKAVINYNSVAKTGAGILNITPQTETKTIIERLGSINDTAGQETLFGKIKESETNVLARMGTINDASSANTLFGKVADLKKVMGTTSDTGSTETIFGKLAKTQKTVKEELQSGILNRETTVKSGNTITVRFRTATGMTPTLDVYDASNNKRISAQKMSEIATTGIYEYDLLLDTAWGTGEFTVMVTEPKQSVTDSMTLTVLNTDLDTISKKTGSTGSSGTDIAPVMNELNAMRSLLGAAGQGPVTSALEKMQQHLDAMRAQLGLLGAAEGDDKTPSPATIRDQLAEVVKMMKGMTGEEGKSLGGLYDMGESQVSDLKKLRNKVEQVKQAAEVTRRIVEEGRQKVQVQTWFESGSVILKILAVNPTDEQQTVPVKAYLPREVRPEHIIDKSDLELQYDADRQCYFVTATATLDPGETVVYSIHVEDIWQIPQESLNPLSEEASQLAAQLKGTEYETKAVLLASQIDTKLANIWERQSDPTLNPEQHIQVYRENLETINQLEADLTLLKRMVASVLKDDTSALSAGSGTPGSLGRMLSGAKVSPLSMVATWRFIFGMVIFVGLMSLIAFMLWQHQAHMAMAAEIVAVRASGAEKQSGFDDHPSDQNLQHG